MSGDVATILKSGAVTLMAEESLRPGDVLLVQAGDLVPADLRLVEARGLAVDEWELTGEIAPVEKRANGSEDVRLYRGSRVTRGSGKGIVVATGAATEYQDIVEQARARTCSQFPPLVKARFLALPILLAPPVVMFLSQSGERVVVWFAALLAAGLLILWQNDALILVGLAARQVRALERRRIQILDVAALSLLPKLTVMCLDKTGVLTSRDIVVKRLHFADDDGAGSLPDRSLTDLAALACALGNDIFYVERTDQGNPIDRALMSFAAQNGVDVAAVARQYKRIYDQPFDSENRFMVAGFERNGKRLFFAKGDPDAVLSLCSDHVSVGGATRRADADFVLATRSSVQAINQQGDIALALAVHSQVGETPPARYTFLCVVQLENPLQPGAGGLISALKARGIRAVMLTGDRPETALEVGRRAGIDSRARFYLTGKQVAAMALSDVARQSGYVSIFARLLPSHKGILVRALQQAHHTVAMVGDGANDVIALRAADVGISFAKHSSPLARRVAKILIHDLADLSSLIASAGRIQRQAGFVAVSRAIVLTIVVLAAYGWLLSRML